MNVIVMENTELICARLCPAECLVCFCGEKISEQNRNLAKLMMTLHKQSREVFKESPVILYCFLIQETFLQHVKNDFFVLFLYRKL